MKIKKEEVKIIHYNLSLDNREAEILRDLLLKVDSWDMSGEQACFSREIVEELGGMIYGD